MSSKREMRKHGMAQLRSRIQHARRWMALMLAMMLIASWSMSAFAVTGSQVAKDGIYSTPIVAYKSGDSKTKSAAINVVVVDGKISDLTFSGSDAKDFKKYLMGEKGTEGMRYLDLTASADAVDAVSSATQGKAKYTIDLKGAIKTALAQAEERSGGSVIVPNSLEDGVYTKEFTAAGKYNATVTVTVQDGKITDISVSGDGDWSTPLNDAKDHLIGVGDLTGVDAISSATQYSQALEDAILSALGSESGDDGSGETAPTLTTYTADIMAIKTKDGKQKTATINVTVSNGKISRISFTGKDADDFEKYLKLAKTGSSKYNLSWYEALVGQPVSEELIVDATSSASLNNATTSSKYQTDLQQALLAALEPLLTKQDVPVPEITAGDHQIYIKGSGQDISITSSADFALFSAVQMDGGIISGENYTASSGSTVIELKTNYLDTLAVGDHLVGIESTSGTAVATLTVQENNVPGSNEGTTGGNGEGGAQGGTEKDPEDPVHVKSITPDGDVSENYVISLNVTGKDKISASQTGGTAVQAPVDVLLVIDVTSSMSTTMSDGATRLSAIQSAATQFVSGLTTNPDSRISLITFGMTSNSGNTPIWTNFDWTSLTDEVKTSLNSAINSLTLHNDNYSYDTTYAPALNAASSQLGSASVKADGNNKYVIFFSDGDASDSQTTITTAANAVKSVATVFSIGLPPTYWYQSADKIESVATDANKYYEASNASEMIAAFKSALNTIEDETKVSAIPMSGVVIKDTLSEYVELKNPTETNAGITLSTAPADSAVTIQNVEIDGKEIKISLSGTLTDGTVYTVSIPVKPSEKAQEEANLAQLAISDFDSNTKAELTYQYASETSKTISYAEAPRIHVAKKVTLTYDANGGEDAPKAETKVVDATSKTAAFDITSEKPVRDGYTFLGWHTDKDAKEAILIADDEDYEISSDTTLYAVWETDKYLVKYEVNGEVPEGYTVPEEKSAAYGEDVFVETVPTTEVTTNSGGIPGTWSFAGWTAPEGVTVEDGSFPMPNSDITFTGTWEFTPNSHKVTYTVSGDAPITSSEVPAEETYAVDTVVSIADDLITTETTKDGVPGTWTFNGWDKKEAFSMPNEDVIITGTWSFAGDKYDVSYIVTGDKPSDYVEPIGPKGVDVGTELDMPAVLTTTSNAQNDVPGTWTFSGWIITAPEGLSATGGKYTMPASNVTISGSWSFEAGTYTVTWKNEDGTVLETDENVAYGATPSYDGTTPTKESDETNTYSFAGWTPEISIVTGDITYTATFAATPIPTYTVTYKDGAEGAVFADDIHSGLHEGDTTPSHADPTREGYIFKGWEPVIADTISGDATYTATWEEVKPQTWTITWQMDNGNEIDKTTVNDGEMPTHTDPVKEEDEAYTYTFAGWTPEVISATGDATYTATFTATAKAQNTNYTVNTETPKHTYEIYQIFTGDYAEMDDAEGEGTHTVLSNVVWGENGTGETGTAVSEEILQALNGVVGEELDATKLAEIEKYVSLQNPIQTITVDGEASVQLPPGYYLIKDKDGTQTGKEDAYTTYITVIVKDYTVRPKSVKPTVDKQVSDNEGTAFETTDSGNATNKNPGVDDFYESADHAINETFRFKLTATLPASDRYVDYSAYTLKFTDTMSAGVTFENIVSVKMGDTDLTSYSVEGVQAGEAGKTWSLTATLPKDATSQTYSNLSSGTTVTVIYNAHLNENAIRHTASATNTNTNSNSVYLEYSNNPNVDVNPKGEHSDEMGKTEPDTVWVFTYEIDNVKRADSENGETLRGAGFTLKNSAGNSIKLKNNGDGTYTVANQDVTDGVVTEMVTGDNGVFKVYGLDAGTYTLTETTTPPGYNTCADTTVTITAKHGENTSTTSADLDLTGSSNLSNTIINQSGSTLPSTGGIGTTIFYILGSILAVGAGVILVSKKRANTK